MKVEYADNDGSAADVLFKLIRTETAGRESDLITGYHLLLEVLYLAKNLQVNESDLSLDLNKLKECCFIANNIFDSCKVRNEKEKVSLKDLFSPAYCKPSVTVEEAKYALCKVLSLLYAKEQLKDRMIKQTGYLTGTFAENYGNNHTKTSPDEQKRSKIKS